MFFPFRTALQLGDGYAAQHQQWTESKHEHLLARGRFSNLRKTSDVINLKSSPVTERRSRQRPHSDAETVDASVNCSPWALSGSITGDDALSGNPIAIPVHDRELNLSHPVKFRSRLGKTLNFHYRQAG